MEPTHSLPEEEKDSRYSLSFNDLSHENEYVVHIPQFGDRIPDSFSDALKAQDDIKGEWKVSNRRTRIEIYNIPDFGARNDTAIRGAITKTFDDYKPTISS